MKKEESISVVTVGPITRGGLQSKNLKVEELADGMQRFVKQLDSVLSRAQKESGEYKLKQIEVFVQIGAKGGISLLGVGGEASASGGIKLVFSRNK